MDPAASTISCECPDRTSSLSKSNKKPKDRRLLDVIVYYGEQLPHSDLMQKDSKWLGLGTQNTNIANCVFILDSL